MPSDYIEITEEANICSLEPICMYLSVRVYSALCLAVGLQEVFSSVCYYISGSCVGPCEEWILSDGQNKTKRLCNRNWNRWCRVLVLTGPHDCPCLPLHLFLSITSRKWIDKYKPEIPLLQP